MNSPQPAIATDRFQSRTATDIAEAWLAEWVTTLR